MAREFFKNLPSQETPFNASRWNGLLDGEESMGSIVVEDITCKNMFNKKLLANPQISPIKYIAIKGKPNTQYTFSSNIPKKFDGVGAYIIAGSGKTNSNNTNSGGVWNGQTRTFTSDNEGYISLGYRIDENISSLNDYWYQIEPGQVATDYVEHKEFNNEPKLLWINSSSNTAFSTQDITLSSSDYSMLIWIFDTYTNSGLNESEVSIKGLGVRTTTTNGTATKSMSRNITRNSDTSFTVASGYNDGSVDDNALIPRAVYGIKF